MTLLAGDLAFSGEDIGQGEAQRILGLSTPLDPVQLDLMQDVGYLNWWHGSRGYPYEGRLNKHTPPGAEGRKWASLASSEEYASRWGPSAGF